MPISIPLRTGLTAHLMFVAQGTAYTVPSSSNCDRDAKPGAADASWLLGNFGTDCEEFKIAPESETYEVMGGQPGGLVVTDVVELSRKSKITWGSQQADPQLLRLLFGTLALTSASSQGNQLEGNLAVKGWLKFQAYDGGGTLRVVGDQWGVLKITDAEPWSGKNIVKAKFELTCIRSTLNTLAFS